MAAITHRLSTNYQSTSLGSQSKSYSASGTFEANFGGSVGDDVFTADATTFEVILNTPIASSYQSMFFLSDGAATIRFADSDSLGNNCTVALTADTPYTWSSDMSVTVTNPALATGAGGTAANRESVAIATGGATVTVIGCVLANAPAA